MSTAPSLTIRSQRSDDWENLFVLFNAEEVLLNSLLLPYISEDAFRERFNNPPAGTYTLVAETSLPSGRKRVVGAAWLATLQRRRRHAGRLTQVVQADYAGSDADHGLLRAVLDLADRWLGLRRVEIAVFTDQVSAIALYGQYGFVTEATMRRYAFRAGVYHDACLMARLRDERNNNGRQEQ